MSSKLTKTEEMAARLYFNDGLKPKEIAQKLGISVNTVYKAISKYRALVIRGNGQGQAVIGSTRGPSDANNKYSDNPLLSNNYGSYIFSINLSIITSPVPNMVNNNNNHPDLSYQNELLKELRELREMINKLTEKLEELKRAGNLGCREDTYSRSKQLNNDDLSAKVPDFLRDNPWIDILKLKQNP